MSNVQEYREDFTSKHPEYEEEFQNIVEKLDRLKDEVIEGSKPSVLHTEFTDREIMALVLIVELLPKKYGTCEEILALCGKYGLPTVILLDRLLQIVGYK